MDNAKTVLFSLLEPKSFLHNITKVCVKILFYFLELVIWKLLTHASYLTVNEKYTFRNVILLKIILLLLLYYTLKANFILRNDKLNYCIPLTVVFKII